VSAPRERGVARTKLSYKETRELESIPQEIAALEAEQRTLAAKMADPEYYRQPPEQLRADQRRIGEIETVLMQKLERWEALEARGS
jgi:ATP-binding cassette subfamily F protein uup